MDKRINIPVSEEEVAMVEEVKQRLAPSLGKVTTAGAVRWALRVATGRAAIPHTEKSTA
jgi:hypothetical protein